MTEYPGMCGDSSVTWKVNEPTVDLASVPETAWTDAVRRAKVIRILADNTHRTVADVRTAARQLGCGLTQVYAMLRRYRIEPATSSLLPRRPGPCPGTSRLSPRLDSIIGQAIETTYLSMQRPRVADLVAEVRRLCHSRQIEAPSRKAIMARVSKRPQADVLKRREGSKAARDRFAPVLGSLESPGPMEIVQIDHTLVDVIAVDSMKRLPIQRPWLTLAIDVYTRCVAGFYLSLDPPSATSVALCISHLALPKEAWLAQRNIVANWPVSGIPRKLHLDNAKEFHSEALRRGCAQYGIDIDYRPVRTPHYGGHIERLIGTLMGKVHLLPGTTFSDIRSKGNTDPEKTAAMTLEEIEQWIGHAIAGLYHQNLHRTIATTPLAAWRAGIEALSKSPDYRPPRPVYDPKRFFLDFLPLQRRQVRREGVRLNSIWYWSDVLRTLVEHPDKLIVRYNPRDLSRLYLQGPDGDYYDLNYADLRRPVISLWEHRLALKRLREQGFAAVDENAIFRAVESMRDITDGATAQTKAMRRQRERRRNSESRPDRPCAQSEGCAPQFPPAPNGTELLKVEEWS